MSVASTSVRAPNALLYVRDPTLSAFPEIDGKAAVWRTPSCLVISCLPDSEGPTTIAIGASDEISRDTSLVFDGELPSPSRVIIVETVMEDEVLRQSVVGSATRVRVWTNGHRLADNVVIGLG
jgi:hypothetical protein